MPQYKIRNKLNGLYSNGSTYAAGSSSYKYWGDCGKTWESLDSIRAHLNNVIRTRGIPTEWEVVEVVTQIRTHYEMSEIIKPEVLMKMLTKQSVREAVVWEV